MKASPILICPTIPLRMIPPQEIDVLRRLLFQVIRGMDKQNDARWRRLWGDLFRAEAGEGFAILRDEGRVGKFHKRHRAILQALFDAQERFKSIDALHDWMKVGAYFVTWEEGKTGKPLAKPRSTAYDVCSEDEMREAHQAMVAYLHEPRSQRYLWPHLKAPQRAEMLESVLNPPREPATC